jgi:nicotinamidase-related amidase
MMIFKNVQLNGFNIQNLKIFFYNNIYIYYKNMAGRKSRVSKSSRGRRSMNRSERRSRMNKKTRRGKRNQSKRRKNKRNIHKNKIKRGGGYVALRNFNLDHSYDNFFQGLNVLTINRGDIINISPRNGEWGDDAEYYLYGTKENDTGNEGLFPDSIFEGPMMQSQETPVPAPSIADTVEAVVAVQRAVDKWKETALTEVENLPKQGGLHTDRPMDFSEKREILMGESYELWNEHDGEIKRELAKLNRTSLDQLENTQDVTSSNYLAVLLDENVTLIVVDMQNDFIPNQYEATGTLAVHHGDTIVPGIVELMNQVHSMGGTVICTKDYHPHTHKSFSGNGGAFPSHCVQGTLGSELQDDILEKFDEKKDQGRMHEVIKGTNPETDSYSALQYHADTYEKRDSFLGESDSTIPGLVTSTDCHGGSCRDFTGSFLITQPHYGERGCTCHITEVSGDEATMELTVNATRLDKIIREGGEKILVCGLCWDLCVIDTAIHCAKGTDKEVILVSDLSRAIWIKDSGGFISSRETLAKMIHKTPNLSIGYYRDTLLENPIAPPPTKPGKF